MPTRDAPDDLLWRVEEACANAYPASREMMLDGWLLRAVGGHSRRLNSVNPLRDGPTDPSGIVEDAVRLYRGVGQPTLFRVPSLVPAMDAPLERCGFTVEGETLTLMAEDIGRSASSDVALTMRPDAAWFDAWKHCRQDADDTIFAAYRQALAGLLVPTAFACRRVGGDPVAVAYGGLHRGLVVLESVVTHPDHRQRGHARAVVAAIMAWAHGAGARAVCLQVAADNEPARALYARLGFGRELYRYHYRVKTQD